MAPAGTSSAGYGVPDSSTAPINALLPDPLTGLPQTGRNINTTTGSYTFTADGRTQGMSTVQQLVQLAVRTAWRSSALGAFGLDMSKVQEQGTNFDRQLGGALALALANLTRQGLITIVNISYLPVDNTDGVAPYLKYRDNTTGTFNYAAVLGP
jgi:hypothetical protein